MKKFLFLLLLWGLNTLAVAQLQEDIEEEPTFWDKVYFGGNFGLQFGNITSIEVSPLMGYRITDDFSAGVGVTYQYFKADFGSYDFKTNIYGGRLFARHRITQQIFAYSEYESLSLEFMNRNYEMKREWVPALFLGGGFYLPAGRNMGFSIMALYNLMHDDLRSPYNDPVVLRIGFTGGF